MRSVSVFMNLSINKITYVWAGSPKEPGIRWGRTAMRPVTTRHHSAWSDGGDSRCFGVRLMNEVALRRAWLVLERVTVFGRVYMHSVYKVK